MKISFVEDTSDTEFEDLAEGEWFVTNDYLFIRTNHGNGNATALEGSSRGQYHTFASNVKVKKVAEVIVKLEK